MKYTTKVKSALALAMSLMVGVAFAAKTDVVTNQVYGATFENAASTVEPLNDYDYANGGVKIGAGDYRTGGTNGWFAAEDDESIVTNLQNVAQGQVLQLNTESYTLTNKFANAGAVNTAIADGAKAYFETEVKFVASDDPKAGIEGGKDATKFAIYAYKDDSAGDNAPVNLVVYHAYYDSEDESLGETGIGYTNEVFSSVNIDVTQYTKIRVEMKRIVVESQPLTLFTVSVNGGAPITSETPYEGDCWMLATENIFGGQGARDVSSINFKGTGEIDNIKIGTLTTETYVAIVDGVKYATWADAVAAIQNNSVVTAYEDGAIDLAAGTITLNKNGFTVTVTTSTSGKKIQDNGDNTYSVVDDVTEATVISVADGTETDYPTLAEALAAAVAGDTVKLNSDVEVNTTVNISKNLILDLGGYELTNTSIREDEDTPRTITVDAGNVVITNGTVVGRVNCYDNAALTIAANTTVDGYVLVWGDGTAGEAGCKSPTLNVYGSVLASGEHIAVSVGQSDMSAPTINVFDGAVIASPVTGVLIYNGTTFTMTGGSITGGDFGVANNGLGTVPTTIAISGGSVTSTNQTNSGCGIYQAGPGALTLSGTAVVSGPDAVEVRAGSVQVLDNARLVATMPYTDPASNTGGNSGHGGVALLISQHTTAHNVSATVDGGTLTGAVAFAEVTVEASNDASKIAGAINGGVLYGSVVSEDVEGLIPSTSTALFSDSEPEGLPEGFEVVEDLPDHPGLYKVQAQTFTVIFVANNETFATSNNIAYNAQVAAPDPAPTKADDDTYTYSFNEWQLGGVAYDFTAGVTSNFTLVADFTASEIPPAGDNYDEVNGDTVADEAVSAAVAAWLNAKKGQQTKAAFEATLDNDGLTLTQEYLLNTDPTVATTVEFKISSIAVGSTVDLQVTLTRTEGGSAVESAINGTLKIKGAATVDGTYADDQTLTDKFNGATTATESFSTENKFFKAVIE